VELKPTKKAVELWETVWIEKEVSFNTGNPEYSYVQEPGTHGDFHRGYGVSYRYLKNGQELSYSSVRCRSIFTLERQNDFAKKGVAWVEPPCDG
jgi:hypothetical protein